jgi:hypothetical protein
VVDVHDEIARRQIRPTGDPCAVAQPPDVAPAAPPSEDLGVGDDDQVVQGEAPVSA